VSNTGARDTQAVPDLKQGAVSGTLDEVAFYIQKLIGLPLQTNPQMRALVTVDILLSIFVYGKQFKCFAMVLQIKPLAAAFGQIDKRDKRLPVFAHDILRSRGNLPRITAAIEGGQWQGVCKKIPGGGWMLLQRQ
jgi:hypothetical protein